MPKMTLTQQFVDGAATCPANKARMDYYDTKLVGFSLKVLKSGNKAYYIRYRDARGKLIERKLGSVSVMKLADARKIAHDVLSQVATGDDPFEKRETLKKVPTLGYFVERWYMPHIKSRKRSWETDETFLRLHILPWLGKLHMDQVKKQHVIEMLAYHRQTHAPASTNRALVLCRYIYNCALRWEVEGVTRNPTTGIDLYPVNNKRDRYLKEEESVRLFEALETSRNTQLPFIVAMLLLTGARRREVLTARWEDMDQEKQIWRIKFNKTGKTRFVPLSDGMLSLLAKIPREEGQGFLFPNPRTGKPFTAIFYSWDTARRQAGMPELRIHDLRHSFASMLVNAGRSLYEVQRLLGHHQITTTQRYAHLSHDSLVSAADSAAQSVPWDKTRRQRAQADRTLPRARDRIGSETEDPQE
ncbi:tyrosine-type recombinase/integrase [Halomonas piscis]|uniref:Tyrosine-type recombinase/integrase n=1 Tax=Halomonas piscis TaxID=3031727 RepID=A0ABY9Z246_9GAMM|nr:tyrosine-type recombinase/integrase [Halomonas piscis]WNK21219.1 tyrosine-type recombinase/integrase [Halomonas piscis]